MNDMTIEDRITGKTDLTIAGATEVSAEVGGLAFKDMSQVMEFAKLMAVSRQAVPKHLRGEPGMCLAVSLQALNWRMDPFAVANKSYSVNDRIAYEAQLVQAVIEQRAPIKGRIKGELLGEGPTRQWRLWCISAEDGEKVEYTSPEIQKIKVKNSPLWQADPDQQLWFYSVRAMCRRHFPDVLLGVYEREEIETAPGMKDITPEPGGFAAKAAAARTAPQEPQEGDVPDAQPSDTPEDASGATEALRELAEAGVPGSPAWDKGIDFYTEGKPLEDCPYDDDADRADFAGGWTFAEKEGGDHAST